MLTADINESEIRSHLIKEIQKLDKTRLIEVYKFIAKSFADDLILMVADAENSGDINKRSTDELIQQYRKRNPYQ